MLRDIHSGKINLILVADLSRLSRSIPDLCVLLKDLEFYKAKFLSVKEQFDTSTPVGEMMIYNMINLAQFERKQTSERISMNFHARAMRGLKNGGTHLLGYDQDPQNTGRLVINETEADYVRTAFAVYLETGSLQQTAVRLNGLAIKPKSGNGKRCKNVTNGIWTVSTVRNLLTNLSYLGKREVNKGNKVEDQESLKPWHRYQIVKASWPAIIEEPTFSMVQKMIEENWKKERTRISHGVKRPFLLSGVIRCEECGMALMGQTAHGRSSEHRYYGHKRTVGKTTKCKFKSIRADEIEESVITHLSEIIFRAGHFDKIEKNILGRLSQGNTNLTADRDKLKSQIDSVNLDIESTFALHSQMQKSPEVIALVEQKLGSLSQKKKLLTDQYNRIVDKLDLALSAHTAKNDIETCAKEFKRGWPKATPAAQKRLLQRLINRLLPTKEGLKTFYVTAFSSALENQSPETKKASELSSEAGFSPSADSGILAASGSPRVYIGGGNRD